ncbi:MAG: hypothetical protein OEV99_07840 [Nitrospira sp.]|nr:hypothetical protein [Nitrospira sp.]MDH5727064.1 hypothetical protein [Nitrospira sp.]
MDNKDKIKKIVPWIDPEERVTAHFLDETDLVAEVTGCTEQVADLSFAPCLPQMKQYVSVPLSRTEVSEDLGRYARDPACPFKRNRLMLVVDENRPAVIYSWRCPLCDEVGDRSDCTVRGGVEAGSSGQNDGASP